jgi:hypothetical protein
VVRRMGDREGDRVGKVRLLRVGMALLPAVWEVEGVGVIVLECRLARRS